jgi:hypothetical protein
MKRYTEKEIKDLQKIFNIYDVDTQSIKYQKIKQIINDYIQICRNIDPEWSNVPELEDEGEYIEYENFDLDEDPIRIVWKERDYCDGWEYYFRYIPWSLLWGDWEEDIELRKEERERKEQEEKEKQIKEQSEKDLLITLIERYGLPPFEEKQ